MRENHLWNKTKSIQIQKTEDIIGNFDIGFDDLIPEDTKDALMRFVYWVEDHFDLPVTLWVDFKYNHYLIAQDRKRVGYKFYWADFKAYPVFDDPDDLPVIELPVRTEHRTMEEILTSFIEAISLYYVWLTNASPLHHKPDLRETEEILQAYLDSLA